MASADDFEAEYLDETGDNFDDLDDVEKDPTFQLTSKHKPKRTKASAKKRAQIKPKVNSEWSDDEIFKLINCVEIVPMLWNAKDGNLHGNKCRKPISVENSTKASC